MLLRPVGRQLEPGNLRQDRPVQRLSADGLGCVAAGIHRLLRVHTVAGVASHRQQATGHHACDLDRENPRCGHRRIPEGADPHPTTGPPVCASS